MSWIIEENAELHGRLKAIEIKQKLDPKLVLNEGEPDARIKTSDK